MGKMILFKSFARIFINSLAVSVVVRVMDTQLLEWQAVSCFASVFECVRVYEKESEKDRARESVECERVCVLENVE